jgi:hypothetical protein
MRTRYYSLLDSTRTTWTHAKLRLSLGYSLAIREADLRVSFFKVWQMLYPCGSHRVLPYPGSGKCLSRMATDSPRGIDASVCHDLGQAKGIHAEILRFRLPAGRNPLPLSSD